MAFAEVNKAPTQREIGNLKRKYRAICKKWDSKKYQFSQAISWDDFENLSVTDFLELKELYIEKKKLYWKIYQLEHPEDTATVKAYEYLDRLDHNRKIDFLTEIGLTTHELINELEKNPNFIEEVTA